MRLNDAVIASERYRGEPTTDEEGRAQWPPCIVWDDDLQGFGVRIYPPQRGRPSRKDFIVTWKVGLRTRTMAIGTFGADCTLRQARKMAREALDLARRGQDPIEARHRALGIGTNEDLASRFLFEHKAAQKKPVAGDAAAGAGAASPDEPVLDVALTPPEAAASDEATEPESVVEEAADAAAMEPASGVPDLPLAAAPAPDPTTDPVAPELSVSPEDPASLPGVPEAPSVFSEPESVGPVVRREPPEAPTPEPPRRQVAPPPAAVKRGPTKVRLLPVPESLYRVIEHGARESSMTIAAYLNALIEIARAAVEGTTVGRPGAADSASPEEGGPSIREFFSQVQEAQAVEVGGAGEGGEPD